MTSSSSFLYTYAKNNNTVFSTPADFCPTNLGCKGAGFQPPRSNLTRVHALVFAARSPILFRCFDRLSIDADIVPATIISEM